MSDKNQSDEHILNAESVGSDSIHAISLEGGKSDLPIMNRRSFFTRTLAGGGAAIAAGGIAVGASKKSLKGSKSEGIVTNGNVLPHDFRDQPLMMRHPKIRSLPLYKDRIEQYQKLHNTEFNFHEGDRRTAMNRYDNNIPGRGQLDRAVYIAASAVAKYTGGGKTYYIPGSYETFFNQDDVWKEKYQFEDDQEKAEAVKSVARLFGAGRVGIAKWDKRFAYEPMFDAGANKTYTWDDVPFTPKSVIMVASPVDYDAIATSPSCTASAANVEGYMKLCNLFTQLTHFVRNIGYGAIGSHTFFVNNVAFGILAGMGEGGRNNMLIMPGIGPRARLAHIVTELDFGDAYDEPHSWGVAEFCESCMKCADACPSGAVSTEAKRSFEPKYEHSDAPGYTWNNQIGALKWHSDSKKCFNFWVDNESDCANCMAACTFNEPDFWHHWLIGAVNPAMPKFVHALMAEAHPAFGYGGQGPLPKKDKAEKFWKSGAGMRTNLSNKNNFYTSGQT